MGRAQDIAQLQESVKEMQVAKALCEVLAFFRSTNTKIIEIDEENEFFIATNLHSIVLTQELTDFYIKNSHSLYIITFEARENSIFVHFKRNSKKIDYIKAQMMV